MPKLDYNSGAQGGISGAATGAQVGGPWGAVAGGIIGTTAGLFGGGRKKKKKSKPISNLDKNQQTVNQNQFESFNGEGPYADLYGYNPEGANDVFDKTIANPAYRGLQEKGIPGVTGAFRNQGLQNSSYAGDAIAKLTRDVQESLDAQRAKYLYKREGEAREAKRSGIENFQNRENFSLDTRNTESTGGFDIGGFMKQISPEMIQGAKEWWNKPSSQSAVSPNVATMGTRRGF